MRMCIRSSWIWFGNILFRIFHLSLFSETVLWLYYFFSHCSCFWVSELRKWARLGRGLESSHPLSAGSRSQEKALDSVCRADSRAPSGHSRSPSGHSRSHSAALREPEPLGSAARCRLEGSAGRVQGARWELAAGRRAPLSPVTCLQGVGVPSETSCPPQAGATLVPKGAQQTNAGHHTRTSVSAADKRYHSPPAPSACRWPGRRALVGKV